MSYIILISKAIHICPSMISSHLQAFWNAQDLVSVQLSELQSTCSKEAGGGHDNDLGILSTSLSIAPFSGSVTITSAYFNVLLPLIGPYCSKKSTFLGVFLLNLIILSTQKADDIWQKFLGF